jgi:hypothetical protein
MDLDLPAPWERATDETPKQFAAFCTYRDLPPWSRSLAKAARLHLELPEGDLTQAQERSIRTTRNEWGKWSAEYGWPMRASEHDTYLDKVRQFEAIEQIKALVGHHADAGRALRLAGLQALAARLQPAEGVQHTIGDGKRRAAEDRVIMHFITEGAKLERAAYGLRVDPQDEPEGAVVVPQDLARDLLRTSPEVATAAAALALEMARAERVGKKVEL